MARSRIGEHEKLRPEADPAGYDGRRKQRNRHRAERGQRTIPRQRHTRRSERPGNVALRREVRVRRHGGRAYTRTGNESYGRQRTPRGAPGGWRARMSGALEYSRTTR